MENLSAVIITYNEEKNITRCIESLQEVADEIVIVDSFSTDKTKEICQKFNVSFFENKFDGYSEQKNYANSLAKNDFILSIDADEALSPELKKSILEEKEKNFSAKAYCFNRLTYYCGKKIKHSGWYPDTKTRIWHKEHGKWEGLLHEKIEFKNEINVKFLRGDLLHYSFHTISQHVAQINKFSEIGAKEAFLKEKKYNLFTVLIKSKWKFIKDFIFKAGFLDGYYGYVICRLSAQATFIKYIKLKELYKKSETS